MDAARFDALIRSLDLLAPRRSAFGVLGGGLTALLDRLGQDEIEGKKKRRRRKPLKRNSFGCVNVGNACRGKDANCCSGICQGKKPKKGKKDKSTCVAHNELDCPAWADASVQGGALACGANGVCYQTTGQARFCGVGFPICDPPCTKDVECEAVGGPGAACIVCASPCGGQGFFCIGPAIP